MEHKKINIEELSKKEIQKVPEGYFEEFPDKIAARISQKPQEAKTIKFTYSYWAVAAAVSLLLVSYFVLTNQQTTNTKAVPCAELLCDVSNDEIYDYLYQNSNEINFSDEELQLLPETDTLLVEPVLELNESDINFESISNYENI